MTSRSAQSYTVRRNGLSDPIGEAQTLNAARRIAFTDGGDTVTNERTGEVLTVPRTAWFPSAHAAVLAEGRGPAPATPPIAAPPPRIAALGVGWGAMTVLGVARSQDDAVGAAARDYPGVSVTVFAVLTEEQAARVAAGERDARELDLGAALAAVESVPVPDGEREEPQSDDHA